MASEPNQITTPGPWFATNVDYPDGGDGPMQQGEDGTWTVSTNPAEAGWRHDGGYPGYGVSEANARLMAASPDLLEALELVWDTYGMDPSVDSAIWQTVRAAITKAKGVQNV